MKSSFLITTLYLLLSVLILTMMVTLLQYTRLDDHAGFLLFKQDWLNDPVWKAAFYIHVFTCFLCLFAGLTQFSKDLLRRQKKTHRLLGKIYVFNILFINVPVGMILAVNANGGLISKVAFSILGILWCFFTGMAWVYARRKQFVRHWHFMIRSYALTLSALTLRLWKPVLVSLTTLDTHTIYQVDAWLGFGLNLLIAEWIIWREKI